MACEQANASADSQTKVSREQSKQATKRIKQLERDLQRKESVLAEAAALMILRKKPTRYGARTRKTDSCRRPPTRDGVD